MIEYLQNGGLQASQILLITPPPIHDEKWKDHCKTMFGKSNLHLKDKFCGVYWYMRFLIKRLVHLERAKYTKSRIKTPGIFP